MRDEVLKFNDTASSWEESKEPHVETEKKKHFNSFGKSEDAAFLIDRRKLEEIPILESFGRKEEFPYEKKITTADPPPQMTPSSKVTYKEESGLSLWHGKNLKKRGKNGFCYLKFIFLFKLSWKGISIYAN